MHVCVYCNKQFKKSSALSNHVRIIHDEDDFVNYLKKHEGFKEPLCPHCGEIRKVKPKRGRVFYATCGKAECVEKSKKRVLSEEAKEKIRKARFNYLKRRTGKTAWERKREGKLSYLEQWFLDNVVDKYSLTHEYDIVNEYPYYPYFIDFAFLNIKLAVELDGKQHFINIENQNRDKKKQEYLISKGWKVFRISFKELNAEKIKHFLKILKNIDSYKPKKFKAKLYKFTNYRKKGRTREEYLEDNKKTRIEKEKINIKKVRESSIDFNKFGWVQKVATLIGKPHQKINNWMKLYCPDILEKSFKRRRL